MERGLGLKRETSTWLCPSCLICVGKRDLRNSATVSMPTAPFPLLAIIAFFGAPSALSVTEKCAIVNPYRCHSADHNILPSGFFNCHAHVLADPHRKGPTLAVHRTHVRYMSCQAVLARRLLCRQERRKSIRGRSLYVFVLGELVHADRTCRRARSTSMTCSHYVVWHWSFPSELQ